ncbi:YrhB domain-containing protein [Microbacterium sp. M3]|uniref:YrhB domain-containing protein n=1 Tax=Microbacterium arthrosphaerae TaxID=792652 RepID=A0ABU4H3W2_9MICO|nr:MULTISPECIES: YrhB domain-containing protein [Microbacterium]MDW4574022.1 YrhB domain-containing protein [Microbacterium arthrosphaerae]MDW7607877.1 YrhB domain-containing protein [Microbacterium sp. M3]
MTRRTSTEARRLAEAALEHSRLQDGVERAILGDPIEAGDFWVFFSQSRAYVERDDLDAMLAGNAPLVVPKDGGEVFALSPAHDIDAQIADLRRGRP